LQTVGKMKLRLHQFLSKTGHFSSKRDVKQAIWDGDITVKGSVIKDISFQFNPRTKPVEYRGQLLELPNDHTTFLLNKPVGYICSRLSQQERSLNKRSVFELFVDSVDPSTYDRLLTVGRLDEATTGLLLVTTDGTLVHDITSPEREIRKTYEVVTRDEVSSKQLKSLQQGVEIHVEDSGVVTSYTSRPAVARRVESDLLQLTISEGKKRQVRRMLEAVGNEVIHLHRLGIESLILSDFELGDGEFCPMKKQEISDLVFQH